MSRGGTQRFPRLPGPPASPGFFSPGGATWSPNDTAQLTWAPRAPFPPHSPLRFGPPDRSLQAGGFHSDTDRDGVAG